MIDDEDELIKQAVLRRFEHLEPLPIDDADYDKEFPLPAPHEPSTCSHCGASYDEAQFLALALPEDGNGVWSYASSNVKLAVRRCGTPGCKNGLARRIA